MGGGVYTSIGRLRAPIPSLYDVFFKYNFLIESSSNSRFVNNGTFLSLLCLRIKEIKVRIVCINLVRFY